MKRLSLFSAALVASVALVACGSDSDGGASPSPSGTSTGSTAQAAPGPGDFKADYKTSKDFFTNMAAPVKGSSPHVTARIWYSSNVKDLVSKSEFEVPEGTVSIKEFDMTGDGTKTGIAVMIKKAAGYDAANGDWYYDMRDTAGNVTAEPPAGKIAMCIQCHAAYEATDYLGGTALK